MLPEIEMPPSVVAAISRPTIAVAPSPSEPSDFPVDLEITTPYDRWFEGTIEVVGEGAPAGGEIEIEEISDGRGVTRRVYVLEGRFEFEIQPETREVRVVRVKLGGSTAVFMGERPLVPPFREPLSLTVRRLEPRTLVVRDAETFRELDDVEIFCRPHRSDGVHPGSVLPQRFLPGLASSPVRIPNRLRWCDLYVRARGHAFGRFLLPRESEGAHEIHLEPAGALRVLLTGEKRDPKAVLRIRRVGAHRPIIEEEIGRRQQVDIADLPAGSYSVAAEIGEWYRELLVLAAADARVAAGKGLTVSLDLPPPPVASLGPLRGVVVIPAGWGEAMPGTVWIQLKGIALGGAEGVFRLRDDDFTAEGFGVFRFDVGSVQVGTWEIEFSDPDYSTEVEVREGGGGVRVELPPPGTALVHVVDERTGQPAAVDGVSWRRVGGYGSGSGRRIDVGVFEVRAASGRIRMKVVERSGHWRSSPVEVDLVPGSTEVTLRARKVEVVDIRLQTDDRHIDLFRQEFEDLDVDIEVVPPDTVGWEMRPMIIDETSNEGCRGWYRYFLPRPGRYRFRVHAPKGCEPVPDVEVDVELGSTVKRTIELRSPR